MRVLPSDTSPLMGARPLRRTLAWATDQRAVTWPVTVALVLAFAGLWMRAVPVHQWPSSLSVVLVNVLTVVGVQWALLAAAQRGFLDRPWWRWHSLTAATLVVVISILASAMTTGVISTVSRSWAESAASLNSLGMWIQRALILLIITAAFSGVDDYRRALLAQQSDQERLHQLLETGVAEVNAQRTQVVDKVGAMLDEALASMRAGRPAHVAMVGLARDRIRPLSHALATSMPTFQPPEVTAHRRSVARDVVNRITGTPLIRPVLMAAAVAVMFTLQTSYAGPPPSTADRLAPADAQVSVYVDWTSLLWGLFFLAVVFAATWISGVIAVRLLDRALPTMSLPARLLWLIATPLLMAFVVEVILQVIYINQTDATALSGSVWERTAVAAPIFAIAVLLAVIRGLVGLLDGVLESRGDVSQTLAWQLTRTQETLQQERHWLALELHGRLQSIVAATALELEASDGSGEQAWTDAEQQLRSALDLLMLGPHITTTVQAHLDDLRATWAGVCNVQVDLDPQIVAAIDQDWVCQRTVTRIITDGVANSAMHGKAGHVHVLIMKEQPDEFLLMICDNGRGQEAASAPGLGSLNLDTVSLRWSLTHGMTGTGLSVVLPLPRVPDGDLIDAS